MVPIPLHPTSNASPWAQGPNRTHKSKASPGHKNSSVWLFCFFSSFRFPSSVSGNNGFLDKPCSANPTHLYLVGGTPSASAPCLLCEEHRSELSLCPHCPQQSEFLGICFCSASRFCPETFQRWGGKKNNNNKKSHLKKNTKPDFHLKKLKKK